MLSCSQHCIKTEQSSTSDWTLGLSCDMDFEFKLFQLQLFLPSCLLSLVMIRLFLHQLVSLCHFEVSQHVVSQTLLPWQQMAQSILWWCDCRPPLDKDLSFISGPNELCFLKLMKRALWAALWFQKRGFYAVMCHNSHQMQPTDTLITMKKCFVLQLVLLKSLKTHMLFRSAVNLKTYFSF